MMVMVITTAYTDSIQKMNCVYASALFYFMERPENIRPAKVMAMLRAVYEEFGHGAERICLRLSSFLSRKSLNISAEVYFSWPSWKPRASFQKAIFGSTGPGTPLSQIPSRKRFSADSISAFVIRH